MQHSFIASYHAILSCMPQCTHLVHGNSHIPVCLHCARMMSPCTLSNLLLFKFKNIPSWKVTNHICVMVNDHPWFFVCLNCPCSNVCNIFGLDIWLVSRNWAWTVSITRNSEFSGLVAIFRTNSTVNLMPVRLNIWLSKSLSS